jgi:hypothetical protein
VVEPVLLDLVVFQEVVVASRGMGDGVPSRRAFQGASFVAGREEIGVVSREVVFVFLKAG